MGLSPVYLRRDKAAQHVRDTWGLPCSPRWLAKLAVMGGGPIFRKAGRIPITRHRIWTPGRNPASERRRNLHRTDRKGARCGSAFPIHGGSRFIDPNGR